MTTKKLPIRTIILALTIACLIDLAQKYSNLIYSILTLILLTIALIIISIIANGEKKENLIYIQKDNVNSRNSKIDEIKKAIHENKKLQKYNWLDGEKLERQWDIYKKNGQLPKKIKNAKSAEKGVN
jgi:uncharacterized membrane-anchored protein YitT (DUF2179 family)